MSRYVAFLRAINVGGHTVKMETLRGLFVSFGFLRVETFIASGNVIFQTTVQNPAALESKIASGLRKALGYEVATFVRAEAELAEIAAYQAFPQSELDMAVAFNIAFLSGPPDDNSNQKLMQLRTDIDNFATHERQLYWLCRKKQSESTFSNAVLEKTLGVKTTLRSVKTVNELAAKIALESPGKG